jgi:hypothetical protein
VDVYWQKPGATSYIQRNVLETQLINVNIIFNIIVYEYMNVCSYVSVYMCISLTQVVAQFQALFYGFKPSTSDMA